MGLLRTFRLRLRSLFQAGRVEQELDDELREHLEREVERYQATGLSPAEARAAALRAFGNLALVQEQCRDTRRIGWIDEGRRDLAYAVRSMRRAPGHTAAAVVSLAVAIGANTTVFSLANALMLRELPVADPQQLVEVVRQTNAGVGSFSYPFFERIVAQHAVFEDVMVMSAGPIEGTIEDADRPPAGRLVSGNFFDALGLSPTLGRLLTPADDRVGGVEGAAVISYGMWQRHFGGAASVLGSSLRIGFAATPVTIVGVLPRTFEGLIPGRVDDFYVPLGVEPRLRRLSLLGSPGANWLKIVGRLEPGVSSAAADAHLNHIWTQFVDEYARGVSDANEQRRLRAQRLTVASARHGLPELRREFARPVLLLMGAVAFVLLIACANVVNLLLARGTARTREMGVRLTMGASRGRLVRQLLAESAALGLLGGLVGLAIAVWGTRALAAFMTQADPTVAFDLRPDIRVLSFTAVIAIGSAVLAGLAPALRLSAVNVVPALRVTGHVGNSGRSVSRSSRTLIASQVALSLLLLAGASLLVMTLRNLRTFDAGFDRDNVALLRPSPERAGYAGGRRLEYYRQVVERARQTVGVHAAGLSAITPISGGGIDLTFNKSGRPRDEGTSVYVNVISDGYFAAMGTPFRRGRDFGPQDGTDAPAVVIVNEALAATYFGSQDPIGQRVRLGRQESVEVVGVVATAKYLSLREEDYPTAYIPIGQAGTGLEGAPPLAMTLTVKTSSNPTTIANRLRVDLQTIAPAVSIAQPTRLDEHIDRSLIRERLVTSVLAAFSVLALLLASVGLYGVLAYSVTRRTNEIGIRLALGAKRGAVLSQVLRESTMLVAVGIAIGIPAALMLTRLLGALLYGVAPGDPRLLGMVIGVLFLVALLAASLPAWKASRVNPLVALRYE